MQRYTSWTRQQDEAEEARPTFRPTSHLGRRVNENPPYRRKPVRLNPPKMGKHGSQKSPQPRRLGLTYVQTPQGQKVVRRNIENGQFASKTASNIVSGESKKTSGTKIPVGLPGTSRPRALKKIDVNRSGRKIIPNMAGSEQLTSPLFPLEEYAPRIAGEANAFQALQGIRNDNRHDLRALALRNASTVKSIVASSVSKTPSFDIYTWANAKIPDSPKLVLSTKKLCASVPYVDLLKLPTCSKTQSTTSETKKQYPRSRTCLLNDFSHQASGALQTVAKLPGSQTIPMTTSVEDNKVALWLSQQKSKYEISTQKANQIQEHEAVHGRIDEQVLADKSCLKPCSTGDILELFRILKRDHEMQIELHQKQIEDHQKMSETHQRSIKSLQDFIDMYSIPVPAQGNCIEEINPELVLNLSIEAQSTTKKRRSLRIAARSGEIVHDESSEGPCNTADWTVNEVHTYIPPPVVITDVDRNESTATQTNNFNKTVDIGSPLFSAKKNMLSRKSISKYRVLQNSFHGILNTPMKTPITKSARKKLPAFAETPSELSRRVQASLELLHDDEETTGNMK